MNRAAFESGYSIETQYLQKDLPELFTAYKENGLFDEYCRVVETGEPLLKQIVLYHKDADIQRISKAYDLQLSKLNDGFVALWKDVTGDVITDRWKEQLFIQIEGERRKTAILVEEIQHINNTLQTLIDVMPAGVIVIDTEGLIILTNAAADKIFGGTIKGTIYDSNGHYTLYRSDGSKYPMDELPLLQTIKNGVTLKDVELLVRHSDAKEYYVLAASSPILNSEGNIIGAVFVLKDISERKRMEEILRENEESFRACFENAAIGMSLVSLDGNFMKANRILCDIVGYDEEELLTTNFQSLTYADDLDKDLAYKQQLINSEIRFYHMEKRYVHKQGNLVWILLSASIINNSMGEPLYYIAQIQDITQRKRVEAELYRSKLEAERAREKAEYMASTDYLTGLLNRRAFEVRLKEEFYRFQREKTAFSLILADIDCFKNINDTYGHQVGDLVLQQYAACLMNLCRPYDFIGRYGGEEFAIGLPNTTLQQAEGIAERVRREVQKMSIQLYNNKIINITSSFGVATTDADALEHIDTVIERADKGLYAAKSKGRNVVCSGNID